MQDAIPDCNWLVHGMLHTRDITHCCVWSVKGFGAIQVMYSRHLRFKVHGIA